MKLRAGGAVVLVFLGVGAVQALTGVLDSDTPTTTQHVASQGNAPGSISPAQDAELDGWIREALAIMAEHGIPGSYEGIHRNIIRESGGDPLAINDWDINAQNGVPSKGLLQVIKPTWDAYWHPKFGVPNDQYDPVANIVVACNYAAARYGSMDNVDGPY